MRSLEGWMWLLFMIGWFINSMADVIDFSFQAGEKNQVTIEKVQKEKKPEESTSDMPKASW